ncbi:hypothetical protein GM51_1755 [freshwater metagenome]|uniref:Rhodanese domain-containing protein n=1 Tax=freshwater metagenome TaxID=449393 RepID=A0A094SRY9_9ZZZZ
MESNLLRERLAGRPFEDVQATFCAVLVDEWIQQGIQVAIVAPGSRSTPLALALAGRDDIRIEVFHDERSAAFAALGVGLATGVPAVLLCTSGTAAAHFYAAVIEADLSHVPLLVVTADRPTELKDVGAPQTIDQTKMYGDTVRWFHDPGVADLSACNSWRALARQSFASTVGLRPGPSHINLPFREPLVGTAVDVPRDSVKLSQFVGRPLLTNAQYELIVTQLSHQSGVIVAGKGCGDSAKVSQLAKRLGWPVLADSRSGCQGIPEAVIYFDSILRHQAFSESHQPQAFLRLGEAPSSKVLSQFISGSSAVQIHVGQFDDPFDADHKVASHITCDPSTFCEALASLIHATTKMHYLNQWLKADELAEASIAKYQEESVGSLSGPTASRIVAESLKTSQNLVVSSSMPVRDLEWFGGDCSRFRVFSNRGANGIDGVVATAIGVAIATERPTIVLIGDVAVLHDSSSLVSLTSREVEVKIVVTDNDGGGIFQYLSQASLVATEKFEKLFGTPHGSDLVRLAEAHQISTFDCRTSSELRDVLARSGTCLIRIGTDRHNEVLVHQEINTKVAFALDHM